ncbi:MAG: SpoIIE family protein phosphatase [Bacteroidia bacterium]|nr:SpoIIE family protein phosphatase [Bacteroidia bacterium]
MRLTIGRRISFGFGILVFLTLLAFALTILTIRDSTRINDKITNLYNPSVSDLRELNVLVIRSKMLINSWVKTQGPSEDKVKLKSLIYEQYPDLRIRIKTLAANWSDEERTSIEAIFSLIDKLFDLHKDIMRDLGSFDSYEDPSVMFPYTEMIDETGEVSEKTRIILDELAELTSIQQKNASVRVAEMQDSFSTLQQVVVLLGVLLPLGGIFIAFFTLISIVRPVTQLKNVLFRMSKGVLPAEKIKERSDEIGDMSRALNELVTAMKMTTEFANEVGSGNFESYYKPLSEEDTLGQALLKMRLDLRENERSLEQKVEERTAEVVQQKQEIEFQKAKIEVLFNHVTDSIRYAKRLQDAILPPDSVVSRLLPESFVLYKPKDIVSGDFYWIEKVGKKIFFATIDCTGHGVPGAIMSIVGHNQLKQAVAKVPSLQPSLILDELSKGVRESLHQNVEGSTTKDGMDMTLCALDPDAMILEVAGAFNPLYFIRDGEVQEIKGNKFPVGVFVGEKKNFTNHKISVQKGDVIYLFSDGYADQFGGLKGKKFMVNQFRQLLLKNHTLPMTAQKQNLEQALEDWKGAEDQVDDILVMGVRIH